MDPEVACRCQLLHRQVTGVTHVRHLCIILEQLLGGGRQQPRRGPQGVPPARGVPAGGPGSPRQSGGEPADFIKFTSLTVYPDFAGRVVVYSRQ